MPCSTLLEIPQEEQDRMLAALRRAGYGSLLALHVLLLSAAGCNPTEIAAFLFGSRSSVYRIVRLYRAGRLGLTMHSNGHLAAPIRTTRLMPWVKRSLGALFKATPRAYGWCRTRWSCATLAAQLKTKHGLEVSAWTVRRWLHEMGWVWNRAKLVAKDDDPKRVERLARLRFHTEPLQAHEVMVFADELDIHLLPKVGAAWMPQGSQEAVMTPGKKAKHYLAGALDLATGEVLHCLGPVKPMSSFGPSSPCWTKPIQSHGSGVSMSWWITTVCIKPKQSSSGWTRSRASRCCGCPPIVHAPIRLSGPLAMCTTNVHETTSASAYAMSSVMSNGTCKKTDHGCISCPRCTRNLRL
jgi:transposase